ncbi:MAG: hypothetical protein HPY68_04680 [Candidatus Atribacteria bacterium]|nr:hypothetical protein [Candidatus Atribacteria bacterium]
MTNEERLERLEREVRQNQKMIRWLMITLGVCVGVWLATVMFPPQGLVARDVAEMIQARTFVVVDEEGRPRITLGVAENIPMLTILDEEERTRIGLGMSAKGWPSLIMLDEKEKTCVLLGISELKMFDAEGDPRLSLGLWKDMPMLWMRDEKENIRALFAVDDIVGPGLVLSDSHQTPRLRLGVSDKGFPQITLGDENKNVIWQAP